MDASQRPGHTTTIKYNRENRSMKDCPRREKVGCGAITEGLRYLFWLKTTPEKNERSVTMSNLADCEKILSIFVLAEEICKQSRMKRECTAFSIWRSTGIAK